LVSRQRYEFHRARDGCFYQIDSATGNSFLTVISDKFEETQMIEFSLLE